MGRKKRGKKPPVPYASGAFFMHQAAKVLPGGGYDRESGLVCPNSLICWIIPEILHIFIAVIRFSRLLDNRAGEDGSGFHFHDANHWLDIISHHVLLLFFIKKLLNTDCHQADYQTHERDKHYAENEADIETPSPDEIIQTEMIHRVIIKIGPVFPHHDINHDANINEEKQSYYQDSLFFFGK